MEEEKKKIHPCNEIPDFNKVDEHCISIMKEEFNVRKTRVIGRGEYGMVVMLHETHVVVKIQPYTEKNKHNRDRELAISGELNDENISIFIHTFGWLLCKRVPKQWREHEHYNVIIENYKKFYQDTNDPEYFLFTFMEEATMSLDNNNLFLTRSEQLVLIFILGQGLYHANKRLGFTHGDIHLQNILLTKTKTKGPLRLMMVGNVEFEVMLPKGHYYPKLIDFGLAGTKKHPYHGKRQTGMSADLYQVIHAFNQRKAKYPDSGDNLGIPRQTMEVYTYYTNILTYEDIETFLLEKMGEVDGIQRVTKTKKTKSCIFCGHVAKRRWDTTNAFVFCADTCGLRIKNFVHFL